MPMMDYRKVVVGADGCELAAPVVGRAPWLAVRDDAALVIVCAFSQMPGRAEA